jgi:hypothetical protein
MRVTFTQWLVGIHLAIPPRRFLDLYNAVALPNPGYLGTNPPSLSKTFGGGDTDGGPTDKIMKDKGAAVSDHAIANGVDVTESGDSANTNLDKKIVAYRVEILRRQGQALGSMAQALLMQIEALNTQVDSM